MKRLRLDSAVRCILNFVEGIRHTQGGGTRAKSFRQELLRVLETGDRSDLVEKLARHHGLGGAIRRIKDYRQDPRLAKAIYARTRLGQSISRALRTNGASRSEWKVVRKLARQLHHRLGGFSEHLPLDTPWVSDLLGTTERMTVVLDQRAAEDMLLTSLEGYMVPRGKGSRYAEIYGICLGMIREVSDERQGAGKQEDVYVLVSRCAAQLRARSSASEVWPNKKSLRSQLDVAQTLFPQLEVVGDFHSHPYKSMRDLKSAPGWRYSDADEKQSKTWVKEIRALRHRPRVAFIVAVAKKHKARASKWPAVFGEHTHQVIIGSHQFVIGAYRILQDGTYSEEGVQLATSLRSGEL